MKQNLIYSKLVENFAHPPTDDQFTLFRNFAYFLSKPANEYNVFLLKGYAGTGKTTLINSLVKVLPELKMKYCLLAPTGRAAKVITQYTKRPAHTIHKKIYQFEQDQDFNNYTLIPNQAANMLYIVDEASMISSMSEGKNYSDVLTDLLEHVMTGNNCRLLFVGDTAQLPPVGMELSNALNQDYLRRNFHLGIKEYELTEVVRQANDSGILFNATVMRELITSNSPGSFQIDDNFPDVKRITGYELEDELGNAFGREDDQTMLVTRSNKRANLFNQQIRTRIKWQEGRINAGDKMMVVKNNYFWLDKKKEAGFIANGDFIELLSIQNYESKYGCDFADASIRLMDYESQPEIDVKIILNAIEVESANLNREFMKKLFHNIELDFMHIPAKKDRYVAIFKSPYFHAVQVKFGYAVTCHKSQGGQWNSVFIDLGYVTEEMMDRSFYRWLYTAMTRAKEEVYLINFPPLFFDD